MIIASQGITSPAAVSPVPTNVSPIPNIASIPRPAAAMPAAPMPTIIPKIGPPIVPGKLFFSL